MFSHGTHTRSLTRLLRWSVAALALLTASAHAQLQVGDNLNMHLNGDIGFTYGGSFGTFGSSRGTGLTGNGSLNGFYYHPKFLSFDIRPSYNRSQTSSGIGFLMDTQGIGSTFSFFGGSRFPGSISYDKSFSDSSQYGIPGAGTGLYTTDSSSQAFSVNWGLLLPNLPTLQASFTNSSGGSSLLGANGDITNNARDINLSSTYGIWGFNLTGTIGRASQSMGTPSFLDTAAIESNSSTAYYDLQAIHALPLNGTVSAGWNHSNNNFDGRETSVNSLNVGGSIAPITRLTVNGGIRYTNNLFGAIEQKLFGNTANTQIRETESKSLTMDTAASYRLFRGLVMTGYATHRKQTFAGTDYEDSQYGGSARYSNSFPFLGMFRFSFGLVDYASNTFGNTGLGSFVLDGGISPRFGKWETSLDFMYSQNVMAEVAATTTSSYMYGGTFKRKFSPVVQWFGSFRGTHSGITKIEGTNNRSATASTGWTLGNYGFTATYSQSDGTSVISPTGVLTPSPITSIITDDYLLFNAKSFAVSGTALLKRRISIVGSYSTTSSETRSNAVNSLNDGDRYYVRLKYKVRKLWIGGTYKRVAQSISASGEPPKMVNSFSIEITRWFDVF